MIKCINYDGVSIQMDDIDHSTEQIDIDIIEENILLKKQIKSLSIKIQRLEKQNKALQQYVPKNMLNLSHIVS